MEGTGTPEYGCAAGKNCVYIKRMRGSEKAPVICVAIEMPVGWPIIGFIPVGCPIMGGIPVGWPIMGAIPVGRCCIIGDIPVVCGIMGDIPVTCCCIIGGALIGCPIMDPVICVIMLGGGGGGGGRAIKDAPGIPVLCIFIGICPVI